MDIDKLSRKIFEKPAFEEELELPFDELKEQAISCAKKYGLLYEENGKLFFRNNIAADELKSIKNKMAQSGMNYREVIKYLDAVTISDGDEVMPLVTLPRSKKSVLSGNWDKGHFEYGDLVNVNWSSELTLKDGSSYTMAEIQILKLLNTLGVYRNEKGVLVYKNKKDQEVKFNIENAFDETKLRAPIVDNVYFKYSPREFLEKNGQRLIEANIFRPDDFSQSTLNIDSEDSIYNERRLKSTYMGIRGLHGYVEYYLGRGTLTGTKIKRNENQTLMMLDSDTAGIFESKHGGDKRLIAYFKLADDRVVTDLYQSIREKGIKESKIAPHAKLGADFMNGRIKEYEPDVFCHQKEGESSSEYAKRLTMMNDQSYQFEVFRPMMKEAGVRLQEISWENQMKLFGLFLEQKDKKEILNFSQEYGADGIKTFLALEFDRNLGDGILKMSQKLPTEEINKIFSKYNELVAQLEKVQDLLREAYGVDSQDEEIFQIKDEILKKGKDLLSHFSNQLKKGENISPEEIVNYLKDIESEALTFFLTFKTLKSKNTLPPIEEIKGLSLNTINGGNVDNQDLEVMENIYQKNYQDNPILEELLIKFKARVEDPNTKFYILKHNNVIKGFVGFTKENDYLKLHSVNVDNTLHGMSIGNTLISKTIDKEAGEHIIKAECLVGAPISTRYIEEGFIGYQYIEILNNPCLEIVRNNNDKFETKKPDKKREDFIREMIEHELKTTETVVINSDYMIVKESNPEDIDFEKFFSDGNVLTRYFTHQIGKDKFWYAVFEKV